MSRHLLAVFAVIAGTSSSFGDDTIDSLFASAEKAAADVKTLEIVFDLTKRDLILKRDIEQRNGEIRLLKTANGEVFASCEISTGKEKIRYVLSGKSIYQIDFKGKSVTEFKPDDDSPIRFIGEYLNPVAFLLDRKLSEKYYTLDLVKQDVGYSYLGMKVNDTGRRRELSNCVIAILKPETKDIASGMPRLIRTTSNDGKEQTELYIRYWKLNKAQWTEEEFKLPEKEKGWTYHEPHWLLKILPKNDR